MKTVRWLGCKEPEAMLRYVVKKLVPSERKLRLCAIAMWWQHYYHKVAPKEPISANKLWAEEWIDRGCRPIEVEVLPSLWDNKTALPPKDWVILAATPPDAALAYLLRINPGLMARQADMLRHFWGNPHAPLVRVDRPCPVCHQGWIGSRPDENGSAVCVCGHDFEAMPLGSLTTDVVELAGAVYRGEDCAFALHDALLSVGCSHVAEHFCCEYCHGQGKRGYCKSCRGTWMIDVAIDCPTCDRRLERRVCEFCLGKPWHPKGCHYLDVLLNKE